MWEDSRQTLEPLTQHHGHSVAWWLQSGPMGAAQIHLTGGTMAGDEPRGRVAKPYQLAWEWRAWRFMC